MKFISNRFAVLVFGLSLFGTVQAAQAGLTQVYGMNSSGSLSQLPERLCVLPGQEIRLQADVINEQGKRLHFPANQFVWRMTRGNGWFDQWDARYGNAYGPFRRGLERNSVYVFVPFDLGDEGLVELVAPGHHPIQMRFVDGRGRSPRPDCQMGDPGIYMDRRSDLVDCDNSDCRVGLKCEEQCPAGWMCRYVPGRDMRDPSYWQVTACPWPPVERPIVCGDDCRVGWACSDGCPVGAMCNFVPGREPYWKIVACPWP